MSYLSPKLEWIALSTKQIMSSISGPTSTSQSADDDEGLQGTGWGDGGPAI